MGAKYQSTNEKVVQKKLYLSREWHRRMKKTFGHLLLEDTLRNDTKLDKAEASF